MGNSQAYIRDQQATDFRELKRILDAHGSEWVHEQLEDIEMEEREAEDAHNCPRGERRPAMPRGSP